MPQQKQRKTKSPWANHDERALERENKREAVLRTAARLFNAKGYHATSLDEVATTLQVTKPTIYHYFANKDDIPFECTRRGLNAIASAAREATEKGGTGMVQRRALLTAYALCMMVDYGICARTRYGQLSHESLLQFRSLKREFDNQLRHVIATGVADGTIATGDTRIAAFTMAAALNGLGNWFRLDGPHRAEQTARLTVAVLLDGLTPRIS